MAAQCATEKGTLVKRCEDLSAFSLGRKVKFTRNGRFSFQFLKKK